MAHYRYNVHLARYHIAFQQLMKVQLSIDNPILILVGPTWSIGRVTKKKWPHLSYQDIIHQQSINNPSDNQMTPKFGNSTFDFTTGCFILSLDPFKVPLPDIPFTCQTWWLYSQCISECETSLSDTE